MTRDELTAKLKANPRFVEQSVGRASLLLPQSRGRRQSLHQVLRSRPSSTNTSVTRAASSARKSCGWLSFRRGRPVRFEAFDETSRAGKGTGATSRGLRRQRHRRDAPSSAAAVAASIIRAIAPHSSRKIASSSPSLAAYVMISRPASAAICASATASRKPGGLFDGVNGERNDLGDGRNQDGPVQSEPLLQPALSRHHPPVAARKKTRHGLLACWADPACPAGAVRNVAALQVNLMAPPESGRGPRHRGERHRLAQCTRRRSHPPDAPS